MQTMWISIDFCSVIFSVGLSLAAILLATEPKWYLIRSVISNVLYNLPWAIALQHITVTQGMVLEPKHKFHFPVRLSLIDVILSWCLSLPSDIALHNMRNSCVIQ